MRFPSTRLRAVVLPLVCTWLAMPTTSHLFLPAAQAVSPPWDHDPYKISAAYSLAPLSKSPTIRSATYDVLPEQYVLTVSSSSEAQDYVYTFLVYSYGDADPKVDLKFYYDTQTPDGPQLKRFKDPKNQIVVGAESYNQEYHYTSFQVTLKPGLIEELAGLAQDNGYNKLIVVASKTDAKMRHCVGVFTLTTQKDIDQNPPPVMLYAAKRMGLHGHRGRPDNSSRSRQRRKKP